MKNALLAITLGAFLATSMPNVMSQEKPKKECCSDSTKCKKHDKKCCKDEGKKNCCKKKKG